jgi:hypothetical protein
VGNEPEVEGSVEFDEQFSTVVKISPPQVLISHQDKFDKPIKSG